MAGRRDGRAEFSEDTIDRGVNLCGLGRRQDVRRPKWVMSSVANVKKLKSSVSLAFQPIHT